MKKIVAILLALAVVSMAFAQSVSISNTLKTEPTITIDGGQYYWGFANNFALRDEVNADAQTADGRAHVKARIRFDLQTLAPTETTLLNLKPRWSWNSADNANDGNRSCVAAWLKPFDFLEVGIGNFDGVDSGWGIVPNLSYGMGPEYFKYGFNETISLAGAYQNVHQLINDGIQVKYIGVPNLEIGFGLRSANGDLNTMVKKGMFNGAALGATYNTDLFGVGVKWAGNFGAENGVEANNSDKAYQDHLVLAGFTFKGLQEAKIGTTLEATVGFYTEKASVVKNASTARTSFIIGVGAGFNFRNGISDKVSLEVGYNKVGSKTSKVLPFTVRNKLSYSVSSDASFSLDAMYSQLGLVEKTKATASKNTGTAFGGTVTNGLKANGTETANVWLIGLKPNFTWKNGAHSFEIGVKTNVIGSIEPHPKSGWEWGWTGLKGMIAEVSFPVSWKYTF